MSILKTLKSVNDTFVDVECIDYLKSTLFKCPPTGNRHDENRDDTHYPMNIFLNNEYFISLI